MPGAFPGRRHELTHVATDQQLRANRANEGWYSSHMVGQPAPVINEFIALFTWHVPIPNTPSGLEFQRQRAVSIAGALANLDPDSATARAVQKITSRTPAPAAAVFDLISDPGDMDVMVLAALRQRLALTILGDPGTKHISRSRFNPALALESMNQAMDRIDAEIAHVAEETERPADPDSLLPADVIAELTLTYLRAALTVGSPALAETALEQLERRAGEISLPHIRFHVLTGIATAHLVQGRPDNALLPAQRARSVARIERNIEGVWEAERIRAVAATATGRRQLELATHRDVAALARRIADDLGTSRSVREETTISELESRSTLARILLTDGARTEANGEAQDMLDRVTKARRAHDAPEERLWEYEVDARLVRVIASGLPENASRQQRLTATEEAAKPKQGSPRGRRRAPAPEPSAGDLSRMSPEYRRLRHEARQAIARAPESMRPRAIWWNTYLEDRHAILLAANGEEKHALRVAKRASRGWEELGETEHAERTKQQIRALVGQQFP